MTDFRLDPDALMDDQHDAPNKRLVNYAEVDADRDGNGNFVAVLVYDACFDDFDSPEAHITRRTYASAFDKDGKRIGGGSNTIVETWFSDFAAFEAADKRRRAERRAENPPPPEPKVVEDAETVEDAWECESCRHVYATADRGGPTYECATCGPVDGAGEDARRCAGCNKFAAKSGEFSCPECGAPEDEQTRVFAKPTDQGTLAAWTYPGMDRDEYLESRS